MQNDFRFGDSFTSLKSNANTWHRSRNIWFAKCLECEGINSLSRWMLGVDSCIPRAAILLFEKQEKQSDLMMH